VYSQIKHRGDRIPTFCCESHLFFLYIAAGLLNQTLWLYLPKTLWLFYQKRSGRYFQFPRQSITAAEGAQYAIPDYFDQLFT
jgi:hypothetical protein